VIVPSGVSEKFENSTDRRKIATALLGALTHGFVEPQTAEIACIGQMLEGFDPLRNGDAFLVGLGRSLVVWNGLDQRAFTAPKSPRFNLEVGPSLRLRNHRAGHDLALDLGQNVTHGLSPVSISKLFFIALMAAGQ
jgi:hypothetical protein